MINLAFRFLGNRPDAEEVAQEVFLRLYQKPPSLSPNVGLYTWLYRVTVNRCIDLLRKRKRTPGMISLDASPDSEEPAEPLGERISSPSAASPREMAARSELFAATRKIVSSLPASLKAPLVLSTLEELSQEAIGEILQISPKAVERRIARARGLLKARLQPYL